MVPDDLSTVNTKNNSTKVGLCPLPFSLCPLSSVSAILILPYWYVLTQEGYCFISGLHPNYAYGQFTVSGSLRLWTSQNNISANADPAGPTRCTLKLGIEGANLCRLPGLRQGTAVRLEQDAGDQELAPCSPHSGVSASRIRISIKIRGLTSACGCGGERAR